MNPSPGLQADGSTLARKGRSVLTDALTRCGTAALVLLAAGYAGGAAPEKVLFDITTREATAALVTFGRQAGLELLFDYDHVHGRLTNVVQGRYEPPEALERLLAGSGLSKTVAADGVFVIEVAPAGNAGESTENRAGARGEPRGSSAQASPRVRAFALGPPIETAVQVRPETIVVTGSRIPIEAAAAPMPIVVVGRSRLEASGRDNIADVILGMPSVGVGVGMQSTRNQTSFGAGRNLVNLRRLGTNRTLVLINGRRQVSGAPLTAAVDLNTIPAPLVERVEIVTGGASAIYGADAVSGVINIILREDFDGLQTRVRGGLSSRGDAASRGLAVTAGKNFESLGRQGNVTLSAFYDRLDGVDAVDRSYAVNGLNVISNPANVAVNDGVPNFIHARSIRFNGYSDAGHFNLRGQTWRFSDDGRSMRRFDFGEIGNRFGRSIGGDGGFFERFDPLTLPIERGVLAGSFRYELASGIDVFLEGRHANTRVQSWWQPTLDPVGPRGITLSVDNPFLPADTVALMRGDPEDPTDDVPSISLHRIVNELGRRGTDNDRTMQQVVTGFRGTSASGWRYEVSYARGRTRDATLQINDRHNARYFQSLDAVRDPLNGEIACRDPSGGCVPLNLVGRNNASAEALAFSRINNVFLQTAEQQVVSLSAGGSVLDLPAGALQVAAGLEYREETALSQPSRTQELGLSFAPQMHRVAGRFDVKEGYLEIRAPVLRNASPAEKLSLTAAMRTSDYSTSGREAAWNAGLEVQPVDGLHVRAMFSRSVRAPNLGELFSSASEGFFFGQDPCDASVSSISQRRLESCTLLGIPPDYRAPTNGSTLKALFGGNPDLTPETGRTVSVGLVLHPPANRGLHFAADYWRTQIEDAINAIPPQLILDNCVDLPLDPRRNPNCALISRDRRTHEILSIQATQLNIGRIVASGIDVQLGYELDLAHAGKVNVELTGTYLEDLNFYTDASDPRTLDSEEGEMGDPRVQFEASTTYRRGPLSATWRAQYIGDARFVSFAGMPSDQFDRARTGTKVFHDLALAYRFTSRAALRLNVINVFDEKPPARGNLAHSGLDADAAIYPNLGTLFSGSFIYEF